MTDDGDAVLDAAMARLAAPGLVLLAGPPGIGRSTLLARVGDGFRGPVFTGGGLAMLRSSPGFALSRALRVRLPTHDLALLAEAVRARVRGGLLLLDDLQWADEATVAALPAIAEHCRVAATLRTPHRLDTAALRATATWLAVPALADPAALALVRQVAPALTGPVAADVVRRAGGSPLAIQALARHATLIQRQAGAAAGKIDATGKIDGVESDSSSGTDPQPVRDSDSVTGTDALTHALATALADLTRPARTAMAALGLLGRPAGTALLGMGVAELVAAGLVAVDASLARPVSPYVAEVAAGLLDRTERAALHRHLAELVPPRESARHLAAAGEGGAAYRRAVDAASRATTAGSAPSCTRSPVNCPAWSRSRRYGCARPRSPSRSAGRRPAYGRSAGSPAPRRRYCAARRCCSWATRPVPPRRWALSRTRPPRPPGPPGTGYGYSPSSPPTRQRH